MTGLEIFAVQALVGLVVGLVKLATRKKPEQPAGASAPEDQVVYPREGTPLGVVFGTVLIEDASVVAAFAEWWGEDVLVGGDLSVVADPGFARLHYNMLLALCSGSINAVVQIDMVSPDDGSIVVLAGGRQDLAHDPLHPDRWRFDRMSDGPVLDLWATPDASYTGYVSYGHVETVYDGEKRQRPQSIGGMYRVYRGDGTTPVSLLDGLIPATTGTWVPSAQGGYYDTALLRLSGAYPETWRGFFHGLERQRVASLGVWVERHRYTSFGELIWQSGTAAVPGSATFAGIGAMSWLDMNPIHVIRELVTNAVYGLGLPLSLLWDGGWAAAAQTVSDEGLGVSFRLNGTETAQTLIDRLLQVVDAVLVELPDGRIFPRLIRQVGSPGNIPSINAANAAAVTWQEASQVERATSVSLTYWSPLLRAETALVVHNEAAIDQAGRIVMQEVVAFGVRDDASLRRLANRELLVSTRPRAVAEATVLVEQVDGWMVGDAVIVDWEYHPPTVFRVVAIDLGTQTTEYARVQLVEDVFEQRGVWIDWQIPEYEPAVTTPLEPSIVVEEAPYWIWSADEGELSGGYLSDLISPVPPTALDATSWFSRAVVYAPRPNAHHSGFRIGSQRVDVTWPPTVTPVGAVSTSQVLPFATELLVRARLVRPRQDATGVHTLLLDAGDVTLAVGQVLRVPVEYPELTFGGATSYQFGFAPHQLSHEYVVVVEVLAQGESASVRIVRGLFDTAVAPEVLPGLCHIVGVLDVPEYAGDAEGWFGHAGWALAGGLSARRSVIFDAGRPDVADNLRYHEDLRGLGVTTTGALAWADATQQTYSLLTSAGGTGTGYIPRAARPAGAGGVWIEEDGGDYVIRADRRSRRSMAPVAAGLRGEHLADPEPSLEPVTELELHVFGDGVWLDAVAYSPSEGGFVVTAGDIAGWGSPGSLGLAVLGVRRDANAIKGIGSWQYAWLEISPEYSAGAEFAASARFAATDTYEPPQSQEVAGFAVSARFAAADTYSGTVTHDRTVTAMVSMGGTMSGSGEIVTYNRLVPAMVGVGSVVNATRWVVPGYPSYHTATQHVTGGAWDATPGISAASGSICVLSLCVSGYSGAIGTPSGWTPLGATMSYGSNPTSQYRAYWRVVDGGWSGGRANFTSLPTQVVAAATWAVFEGATAVTSAQTSQSTASINPPGVTIDAWKPRRMYTVLAWGDDSPGPVWGVPAQPSGYTQLASVERGEIDVGKVMIRAATATSGSDPGTWTTPSITPATHYPVYLLTVGLTGEET